MLLGFAESASEVEVPASACAAREVEIADSLQLRAACEGGQRIELSGRQIADVGAVALAAMLRALPAPLALTRLDLSDNDLTASGIEHLALALRECGCPKLRTVYINNNEIGDAGCVALAGALPPTVVYLYCGAIGCGDVGLAAMLATLGETLEEIHLCGNEVGNDGFTSLAETLQRFGKLTRIYASDNHCGDDGGRALIKALAQAPQLVTLLIDQNALRETEDELRVAGQGVNYFKI
eukprot:SAG11_NODE_2769_length_2993_cov_3.920180_4_plen_238_part_00